MKSILLIATAIVIASCTATHPTAEQVSWQSFCTANGYAISDSSDKVINQYLDTWCGSSAEEAALTAAGVELF